MSSLSIAKDNLARALRESVGADLPYAGGRWDNYCSHARVTIDRFTTARDAIRYAQSPRSGFETRQIGAELVAYAAHLEGAVRTAHPNFVEHFSSFRETQLSDPATTTELGGRLVSAPTIWHMLVTLRVISMCRPATIVEIGGGTGGPARTWMTNSVHNPTTYIDIDFPESLFYAEVFIREALPDVEVVYVNSDFRYAPSDKPRILLCPIAQTARILDAPADLFINAGSMQEMSDDYVSFYVDLISRSRAERFFSFNYFCQPIDDRYESMNVAAPVMPPEWKAEYLSFHPDDRNPTAEMMFRREAADLSGAVQIVEATSPASGEAFLHAFDAARKVQDPMVLQRLVERSMRTMPYLPKELVWLARRARGASPEAEALCINLEQRISSTDVHAVQDHSIAGELVGNALVIGADSFPIVPGACGALENCIELENAVEIAGWGADLENRRPGSAIVATADSKVVARTVAVGARPDIEAGYGETTRPVRFTLRVPLTPGHKSTVRLFVIASDGRALQLSSALWETRLASFPGPVAELPAEGVNTSRVSVPPKPMTAPTLRYRDTLKAWARRNAPEPVLSILRTLFRLVQRR